MKVRNKYGEIVAVKYIGAKIDTNHIRDNYYLFYDEDEVYHVEKDDKIIGAFPANSRPDALKKAEYYIIISQLLYKILHDNMFPSSEKYELNAFLSQVLSIINNA